MIIVLKQNAPKEEVDKLVDLIQQNDNITVSRVNGAHQNILGLIGDTAHLDIELLQAQEPVEAVKRVQEPYKNANRKFHPDDTIIDVEGRQIGGNNIQVIAGPCSVENEDQIIETAIAVKEAGATFLRGGAFKPRTSPYAFQGLHGEGIKLLLKAKAETGLPIVTEIMSITHLDLFADVDIIQVGARNMQNFELLKELGKTDKPILLKRGLANTLEEWLMSAEYIMAGGNSKVILCERGIRTFETKTRNTLDISAVPLLKQLTHLPIVVDPSHATGKSSLIAPLAKTAVVAGADGLMIEVHPNPQEAWCDGAQSITPEVFSGIMTDVRKLCEFENKNLM